MCLEKRKSVEMNVETVVVFSVALFENLTFAECVAANDCSLNSDDGEGFFFAKKLREAS